MGPGLVIGWARVAVDLGRLLGEIISKAFLILGLIVMFRLWGELVALGCSLLCLVVVESLTFLFFLRASLFISLLVLLNDLVRVSVSYRGVYGFAKKLERYLEITLGSELAMLISLCLLERVGTELSSNYIVGEKTLIGTMYSRDFALVLASALLISSLVNFVLKISSMRIQGKIIGVLFIPFFLVLAITQSFNIVLLSTTPYLKLLENILAASTYPVILAPHSIIAILLILYLTSTILLLISVIVVLNHIRSLIELYQHHIT